MSRNSISRREFIKLSCEAGIGLLATACGANLETSSPTEGVKVTPTIIKSEELEKEFNLLTWGSYVDFAIKPFEEKYSCKVNAEYYGNEEEAMSKAKAAPGKYDVLFMGSGWLEIAAKQGLIQPLDVSRIATYEELYDAFKPGPMGYDGKVYGMCYAFGTNAVMYNTELMPEGFDSWEAFWDPKYKGKTALSDKSRDQYIATMYRLGLDFNAPKEEDWERIKQSIKDRAKNMLTIWSSEDQIKRMMIAKEVYFADSYDGLTGQISKEYPSIKYQIPREGTYGWYDGPEILTDAPHPNLAYKWLEFVTTAEMGKQVAENVFYAPANSKTPALLTPELRKQLNLEDPETLLKSLKYWQALGVDWDRQISDAWSEAKAEAGV